MPAKHLLAGAPGARLPLRRAYAACYSIASAPEDATVALTDTSCGTWGTAGGFSVAGSSRVVP